MSEYADDPLKYLERLSPRDRASATFDEVWNKGTDEQKEALLLFMKLFDVEMMVTPDSTVRDQAFKIAADFWQIRVLKRDV